MRIFIIFIYIYYPRAYAKQETFQEKTGHTIQCGLGRLKIVEMLHFHTNGDHLSSLNHSFHFGNENIYVVRLSIVLIIHDLMFL